MVRKSLMLPAPLWKRVVAYLIDTLILVFILSPLNITTGFTIAITSNLLMMLMVSIIIILSYWSIMEYLFNQTAGKIIMKIKVVSLAKGKLKFKQTLVRNLSKISSVLLVIDCLNMFIKKTNQRYLETLTNTEVLEVLE